MNVLEPVDRRTRKLPIAGVLRYLTVFVVLGASAAAAQVKPQCGDLLSTTATPYPAPTWTQVTAVNGVPDYVNVSKNLQIAQDLRLLESMLEKAIGQLQSGDSAAADDDADGACLCNCDLHDAAYWVDYVESTVMVECQTALQKTQDNYLADLQAKIDKLEKTIYGAAPGFESDLRGIIEDSCKFCQPQNKVLPLSFISTLSVDAVKKTFDTVYGPKLTVASLKKIRDDAEALLKKVKDLLAKVKASDSAWDFVATVDEQQMQDIVDETRALYSSLADLVAAVAAVDPQATLTQAEASLKAQLNTGLVNGQQAWTDMQSQVQQKLNARIQDVKSAAKDVYKTATDGQALLDAYRKQLEAGLLDHLGRVEGCYGITKRSECTLDSFCKGTTPGQLFGSSDLALPLWVPTDVFKDGKSALRWAFQTIGWLTKVKKALDGSDATKHLKDLLALVKNGKELLDQANEYVDTYTDGFHLGAYSDIRPDLHLCVGYLGHGVMAEVFSTSGGSFRGGANYLSANLSERHRAQFRSGGFALLINGRTLPLAPGVSLNAQIDGFRLWDRDHPFGLGGAGPPNWEISETDINAVDVFHLDAASSVCGSLPCPISTASLLLTNHGYFPIRYDWNGQQRDWPRTNVAWESDARLGAVFGAGLNLDLKMKTRYWSTPPIPIFTGASIKPWLSLDAGVSWLYGANKFRKTLQDQINKNLVKKLTEDDFGRDFEPLQAPDVTEDIGSAAFVNPKLGADLVLGISLAKWLEIGIVASLHVSVDVKASGVAGVLDLNRTLVETLASSNPTGGDCKATIKPNVALVCSNELFKRKDGCAGAASEDCIDLSGPSVRTLVSTGTYRCEVNALGCTEGKGYCTDASGKIVAHDVTRSQCEGAQPEDFNKRQATTGTGTFRPYLCVQSSKPTISFEGPDCHPLEFGYPSACPPGQDCSCDPKKTASCPTGRTCRDGACLTECDASKPCGDGLSCQAGACVMANGLPFAEQIVWKLGDAAQPRHAVASYGLDKLDTRVALGLGLRVGMRYRLFKSWKEKNLLDLRKDLPLAAFPLVKHQLGLEARYQDDCSPSAGQVVNHQPDLVKRYGSTGTSTALVDVCKPAMASDAQNPTAPPDVDSIVAAGIDETLDFGVQIGVDYWGRAQLCAGGKTWDRYLTDLKADPSSFWAKMKCTYAGLPLDCTSAGALQGSLAAGLGCLDGSGPLASTQNMDLLKRLTAKGTANAFLAAKDVFDLRKLFVDAAGPLARPNVTPAILALESEGFDVNGWLAALDLCVSDAPKGRYDAGALDISLNLDELEPCPGVCCTGTSCTNVENQAQCGGLFQPGLACASGDACRGITAPSPPRGACVVFGRCQEVVSAEECQGNTFHSGKSCADVPSICAKDADCPAAFWCRPSAAGPTCVPAQAEGGGCEGRSMNPERCGPGLVCRDWADTSHDAGGYCRRVCTASPVGLAAWWPLDEEVGPRAAEYRGRWDGRSYNGAAPTAGIVGRGLSFDGVDDYLEVPSALDLDVGAGDFSFVTWIRTTQATGTFSILDKRTSLGGAMTGYHLYLANGRPGLQLADGAASNYLATATIADGAWHLLAVTVARDRADGIHWYLDGQPGGTGDPRGRPGSLNNPSPLRFATRTISKSGWWKGSLDEVALYSRALPASEIARIRNAGAAGVCKRTAVDLDVIAAR